MLAVKTYTATALPSTANSPKPSCRLNQINKSMRWQDITERAFLDQRKIDWMDSTLNKWADAVATNFSSLKYVTLPDGVHAYAFEAEQIGPEFHKVVFALSEYDPDRIGYVDKTDSGYLILSMNILQPEEIRHPNPTALATKLRKFLRFFAHEFTHVLDSWRHKGKNVKGSSRYNNPADKPKYYNHSGETNAFYMEAVAQYLMKTKNASEEERKVLVPQNFREFLPKILRMVDKNYLEHLTTQNKQKLIRRLSQLHGNLVKQIWK